MEIQIHPLQEHHNTEAFTCGEVVLDSWLRSTAKQHVRKGISRTFVAVEQDRPQRVLGFYSLTVGEAETALPATVAKTFPRKIPIVLLGRLTVATGTQGQGMGGHLLVDALRRTVRIAADVGISAILVDAKNKRAETLCQHYGFQTLPDSPHRLVLPLKTAMDLFEV